MKYSYQDKLLVHYIFSVEQEKNKDSSKNKADAVVMGENPPEIQEVAGKPGLLFKGGKNKNSYLKLPENLFEKINDNSGITITTWIYLQSAESVWERIIDFGKNEQGPYLFLTRNMRGTCFLNGDISADTGKGISIGEWAHIAFSVTGTAYGTRSNAGPRLYINGELAADGYISQTSSGNYKLFREWMATFENQENYSNNFLGSSQYEVDPDFSGLLSDFRIYAESLNQDEITDVMCDALSDTEMVELACKKYLIAPDKIVTKDLVLAQGFMGNKIQVKWFSDNNKVLEDTGKMMATSKPELVTMTAEVFRNNSKSIKNFQLTVMPVHIPPYEIQIHGDKEIMDISSTLYGLFFEDINNAADGGIYGELIQNRSFEDFIYEVYDSRSGENGISSGRKHQPLNYWFLEEGEAQVYNKGEIQVYNYGGLNEFLNINDPEINETYITLSKDTTIYNRGFTDANHKCAIMASENAGFDFSVWAKNAQLDLTLEDIEKHISQIPTPVLTIQLVDQDKNPVSDEITIEIETDGNWKKYNKSNAINKREINLTLTAFKKSACQLRITTNADISLDMVSLMPTDLWGAKEEPSSPTAVKNYNNNPNYRLRRDLVKTLQDMHPRFLRFPGGCISEGSYIWDNVYDWKDSVDKVELRKENFNVWGYMMTMGLGYMEYFQLAEDLNCEPLPVMACGVLCQARSDYANPAGGKLQKKYIDNFTDLIDFAISIDYENNKWALLRKEMGHEEPFNLHLLGVGNENWGTEFFASFQVFKKAIDEHMSNYYPGYMLQIISTVGAQADDDSYQKGWKFLAGKLTGDTDIPFTDGVISNIEHVNWYPDQKDYMETIADEHFYRSNEYLYHNTDRYQYYERSYLKKGVLDEMKTSKVFVGEYASSDKNTLAGALAEAAVMTGFEKNSDVVRLAAYAPLFNKARSDNLYRWTPDCIWFDDETVWRTPNYYVQQLFARYLGKKLIDSSFYRYINGVKEEMTACGGIELAARNSKICIHDIKIYSNYTGDIIYYENFKKGLSKEWQVFSGNGNVSQDSEKGLILEGEDGKFCSIFLQKDKWSNYRIEINAVKEEGTDGFYVGAGITNPDSDKKDGLVYAIGYDNHSTGIKVYKDGIEGYTLGDYSTSTSAGNMRDCNYKPLTENFEYHIVLDYGGKDGKELFCSYDENGHVENVIRCRLDCYNKDIFYSITKDAEYVYLKMINNSENQKKTRLSLDGMNVQESAKLIFLTGEKELLDIPDVNSKNMERIIPVESTIQILDNETLVILPGFSLTVVVFEIKIK